MSRKEKRRYTRRQRWPLNLIGGFLSISIGVVGISTIINLVAGSGPAMEKVVQTLMPSAYLCLVAVTMGLDILIKQPLGAQRPEKVARYAAYGKICLCVAFAAGLIMYFYFDVWWAFVLSTMLIQAMVTLSINLFMARKPIW